MNRITLYTPPRNPGKAGVMNVSGWMNLIISRNTSFLQQVKTINASFVTMLDTRELLFESANSTVNRKYMYSLPPPQLRAVLAGLARAFKGSVSTSNGGGDDSSNATAIDGVFFGDEIVAPFSNISAVIATTRDVLGPDVSRRE